MVYIQWTLLIVATSGPALILMWILGHGFSGHYNRLDLISVDIISGVYCIYSNFRNRINLLY